MDGSVPVIFLSPIPALIGAAVALPALLLLYFLKLRRREVRIPTTMLWIQSVEDLEANAPFQRLKPSLLFWLQLLIVLALLMALARPAREIEGSAADAERLILMVDVSASMEALVDVDREWTRFDEARREAGVLLDRLSRRSTRPQVMLMAVGYRPQTVVPWTADLSEVRTALERLEVREEPARFGPAMQLADVHALASGGGQAGGGTGGSGPVQAVLFSDGRFGDNEPTAAVSSDLMLEYVCIGQNEAEEPSAGPESGTVAEAGAEQPGGPGVDNIGIVTLAAARASESDDEADILVVLANAGQQAVRVPVRLDLSGEAYSAKIVEVPAAEQGGGRDPGRAAVEFRVPLTDGALVLVSLARTDQLAIDNTAAMVLQRGLPVSVLTVAPSGRPLRLLRELLDLMEVESVEDVTPAVYEERASSAGLGRSSLVVFDRYSPLNPPPLPSLSFGGCPPLPVWDRVVAGESNPVGSGGDGVSNAVGILSWDRMHPLLLSVGLDGLIVTDRHRIAISDVDEEGGLQDSAASSWSVKELVLADDGGALIALAQRSQQRHVAVAFDLLESNWPIEPSFAVFVHNVIELLSETPQGSSVGISYTTRQSITLPVGQNQSGARVRIEGPKGWSAEVTDVTEGVASVSALPYVGLYRYRVSSGGGGDVGEEADTGGRIAAVNLLSEVETDIRPVPRLAVNGREVEVDQAAQAGRQELWPWCVGLAVLCLFVEWWIYTRRASL